MTDLALCFKSAFDQKDTLSWPGGVITGTTKKDTNEGAKCVDVRPSTGRPAIDFTGEAVQTPRTELPFHRVKEEHQKKASELYMEIVKRLFGEHLATDDKKEAAPDVSDVLPPHRNKKYLFELSISRFFDATGTPVTLEQHKRTLGIYETYQDAVTYANDHARAWIAYYEHRTQSKCEKQEERRETDDNDEKKEKVVQKSQWPRRLCIMTTEDVSAPISVMEAPDEMVLCEDRIYDVVTCWDCTVGRTMTQYSIRRLCAAQ